MIKLNIKIVWNLFSVNPPRKCVINLFVSFFSGSFGFKIRSRHVISYRDTSHTSITILRQYCRLNDKRYQNSLVSSDFTEMQPLKQGEDNDDPHI